MDIERISEDLSVSAQIAPDDVSVLRERGFASIICNRPDGESHDQVDFSAIADAAGRSGLESRHIPVISGQIGDANIAAFRVALAELPGPVLAYCRTGTRSRTLYDLATRSRR